MKQRLTKCGMGKRHRIIESSLHPRKYNLPWGVKHSMHISYIHRVTSYTERVPIVAGCMAEIHRRREKALHGGERAAPLAEHFVRKAGGSAGSSDGATRARARCVPGASRPCADTLRCENPGPLRAVLSSTAADQNSPPLSSLVLRYVWQAYKHDDLNMPNLSRAQRHPSLSESASAIAAAAFVSMI